MLKVSPIIRQFLALGCCNLISLSMGLSIGWSTINFIDLQNENSPLLLGKLSLYEATLAVSINSFGGIVGNFIALPMKNALGAKRLIHFLGIPIIMSILLIIWAYNIYLLYISRILAGFVGGTFNVAMRVLIAEVAHDEIRGTLNSIADPAYNVGLIFSFLLGNYFDCVAQAKIHLIPSVVFVIIMLFLPESPEHHLKQNNKKAAIKSLKFYKGKATVAENNKFSLNEREKFIENGTLDSKTVEEFADDDKLTWSDFLTPEAKRSIFVGSMVTVLSLAAGLRTLFSYVTAIFVESGSNLSAKTSSILIIAIKLSANAVTLNIVDRFNRRSLLIFSSAFTAIGYFLFAAYCSLLNNVAGLEWMAPFCFGFIVFVAYLGVIPIPMIIIVEIFPKKIRNSCIVFASTMLWIVMFFVSTAYPIAEAAYGLPACLIGFGVLSLVGAVFAFCFLPETRGKSYDEIMESLRK